MTLTARRRIPTPVSTSPPKSASHPRSRCPASRRRPTLVSVALATVLSVACSGGPSAPPTDGPGERPEIAARSSPAPLLASGPQEEEGRGQSEVRARPRSGGDGRRGQRVQRVHPPRYHPFEMPMMPDEDPAAPRPPVPREAPYEFYFTRLAYSGYSMRGFASWSVDFPKADRLFLMGAQRLVNHLDAYSWENPILLDDPNLGRYPFLYAVEVGYMSLTDEEAAALRRYLLAGGFLVIDDFWGSWEWQNLEQEFRKVLPEYRIEPLSLDHPVFHSFYDVDEIVQVPNLAQGRAGGPTWERDGFVPEVRGISDDQGRLMVVINWNSDLGDAWEWADDPYYPLRFSTYAYQMGVNYIVYAMSH